VKTATEDGIQLANDENENEDEDAIDMVLQMAERFLRMKTVYEGDTFSIFIESGNEREIEVTPVGDHREIEVSVKMPIMPDELFHFAGYPNATKISTKESQELFYIPVPDMRRVKPEKKAEVLYYPSEQVKLWLIFKYSLEKVEEDVKTKVIVDNASLLRNMYQNK
jgi:hypothetical protein